MAVTIVTYNGLNLYKVGGLRFLPGANNVDTEAYERAKETYPLLRHRLETGLLVEGRVAEKVQVVERADGTSRKLADLGALSGKEAVALVKATLDRAVLTAWLESDGRANVRKAIEEQLELTDPANNPPTDGEGGADKGGAEV